MKAVAVFPQDHSVRLIDHPEPKITAPTQVKLRMVAVGVCGTDKEICAFEYGTPPAGSDYLVIGHESLGEVIEVGKKVKRLKRGDLVVTMVRRPCANRDCLACQAGRQDFCYSGNFAERGIKEAHGFMTEFVVDEERYMTVVPRRLRDVGVLVEPLTIAEKALRQVGDVQDRLPWLCSPRSGSRGRSRRGQLGRCHRAVVLGAGPVGLLGAMAIVNRGFETFVYSRGPVTHAKAALTRSFGATYISAETHNFEQLARRVGNIDFVYEAAGASQAAFELIQHLGTNGVFVFTGVPGRKAPIQVDTDLIMRNLVLKNQDVIGTVNASRENYEHAIRDLGGFMRRWPKSVRALITGRFPIEQHQDLLCGHVGGIKNVIQLA